MRKSEELPQETTGMNVTDSRDVISVVPKDGVRRALLIATGSYNDEGIPDLNGVDPDVDLIRECLLNPCCGFKEENIVVLKSGNSPARKKIENTLTRFLKACKPHDFIFLYFAGHGFRDQGVDYYVPCDAEVLSEPDETISFRGSSCFSFEDLREKIGQCPAKFKWVIVDVCRTNHTARDGFDEDPWNSIGELKAAEGSLWFQSCGKNQKSYEISIPVEGGAVSHGMFTWYFCEGAKGAAADRYGRISPTMLFDYTRQKMKDANAWGQKPLKSCDDLSGDFVFVDLSAESRFKAKKAYDEARVLFEKGNHEQARAKIVEALEYEPENETFLGLKAQIEYVLELKENASSSSDDDATNNRTTRRTYKPKKLNVDHFAAAKHAQEGNVAFDKKDYLLAKEKGETALELYPASGAAKDLLEKTQVELDKLEKALQEGNRLFDARKYEEAVRKAREIKSLCVNYPKADVLENKAKTSWIGSLIVEGEERLKRKDGDGAREKARLALQIDSNDADARELEKKAIKAMVDVLVDEGFELLERNDGNGAREKARQAFELISDDPDARELEKNAIQSIVDGLVAAGWDAYGFNNKSGALAKAREALALNSDDEGARKLQKEASDLISNAGVDRSEKRSFWGGLRKFFLGDTASEGGFFQTEPGSRATLTYNGVEFAFRYCPAGSFVMGSPADEEGCWGDEPQRSVTINEGFWICKVPTTQEQWDAVGCEKANECYFEGAKLPVENVSWYESDGFVKKLNALGVAPDGWRFDLPTEEQWEYACRAGTTGATYGVPLDDCAWYSDNSGGQTHKVGGKKPNNWGIYDMLGNVWEWTSSNYEGGSSFVFRGGCWCNGAQFCRPADRYYGAPTGWNRNLGFRAVLVRSQSR